MSGRPANFDIATLKTDTDVQFCNINDGFDWGRGAGSPGSGVRSCITTFTSCAILQSKRPAGMGFAQGRVRRKL